MWFCFQDQNRMVFKVSTVLVISGFLYLHLEATFNLPTIYRHHHHYPQFLLKYGISHIQKFICLPSNKVVEKSIEDIDDVVVDNINFTLCYSLFYAKMSQSF